MQRTRRRQLGDAGDISIGDLQRRPEMGTLCQVRTTGPVISAMRPRDPCGRATPNAGPAGRKVSPAVIVPAWPGPARSPWARRPPDRARADRSRPSGASVAARACRCTRSVSGRPHDLASDPLPLRQWRGDDRRADRRLRLPLPGRTLVAVHVGDDPGHAPSLRVGSRWPGHPSGTGRGVPASPQQRWM